MKPWVGLLIALLIVAATTGCAPKSAGEGYVVMFDGPVNVIDKNVYLSGVKVGTITQMETSASNVTRIVILPLPDFKDQLGTNMALYADAGRLEVAKLNNIGPPLEKTMPLCGFSSKSQLNWFKFKTLLGNRISAAQKRALELQARFK